jgi:ABC-type glycerol-3-phosphate transport system permease component
MAVVQSRASHWLNRAAIALALVMLVVSMIPLYWIGSTAFKARADASTVPPTVFFRPEITPFIKLFTARVQERGARDDAEYAKAPWWEKLVMEGGDRFIKDDKGQIESSGYFSRFLNSIVIAVSSTFLAVAMGTITAYGFSRFKMPGEDDWLFFILSTRMLPPVVVAIPMFLMYRVVGLVDTHIGLIILYTAFNLSFSVWLMKGFIDEIPKEYEEAARRLHAHGGLHEDRPAAGHHRHRRHRGVLLHHGVERVCVRPDDDESQCPDGAALHTVAAWLRPHRLDGHRRRQPAVPDPGDAIHLPVARAPAARCDLRCDPSLRPPCSPVTPADSRWPAWQQCCWASSSFASPGASSSIATAS